MTIDTLFEQMWNQHSECLLDRQQQALLRCWRDAPEKLIPLFETYIEQRAGRVLIEHEPPPVILVLPRPAPTRRCCHCGGPNYRQKAKHCYACYRQNYLIQKERRAA